MRRAALCCNLRPYSTTKTRDSVLTIEYSTSPHVRMALWAMAALSTCMTLLLQSNSVAGMAAQSPTSTSLGQDSCLIEVPGDLNLSGTVTSADIIHLVNYVFLTGPPPQPCVYAGDVSCSGQVSSADIIWLVNFVFKSGPDLCNVCDSATPYDCVE